MSYIYDILANFNDCFYEFFDWNENDNIIHIKKLPILKVSVDFFNKVKYCDVVVDGSLIEKIYRRTDFFSINKNKYNYVCCLCDGSEAIIVNFDSKGNVLGRSSLLIDEENEVIDISEGIDLFEYNLSVLEKHNYDVFKTRKEISINHLFFDELKCMDDEKLKYLYFECFNERENDVEKIINRINDEIINNFNSIYSKIYNFLKLTINK